MRQSLAGRFERQARRYPRRLAVKIGARSMTYAALNSAANRVARAILSSYPSDERIAVYCGALHLIVGSLAVLKAGKVLVPMNPQLPRIAVKRILSSLDDCPMLTDDVHEAAGLEIVGSAVRLLNVEGVERRISPKNLNVAVAPHAIAYINFTSGTTGEPKGVVWNHRSELFGIKTKTDALKIVPADRISLLRSNNVGAMRDMFLALLNGAALIVLDLQAGGLASLGDWLRKEKITVFTCVATVFRQAVNGAGAKRFLAVRLIHIGGEPVFKSDVELYRKCFSDRCRFVCRYSISETQAVCYYFIDHKTEIDGERVPVGHPISGSEVLILDDNGREAAPGKTGEIAVRSSHLALGYWRRPDLTHAKFLGNPRDPARTYRTGDLGYRRPDGCLIHLGRRDFQAKVKGHRVEIAAVESALHDIPSIAQAVVVAAPDAARGSRLVAHVVAARNARPDVGAWRRELKTKLPPFMIPAEFLLSEKLPLNTSGKVDRGALPAAAKKRRNAGTATAVPGSAVETVLTQFWSEIFDLDAVSIHDDWASVGGDSLAVAQLATKIADLFPLDATPAALFQTASIVEMARFIIDHELQAGQAEKIAAAYLAVQRMSDEDVRGALHQARGAGADG